MRGASRLTVAELAPFSPDLLADHFLRLSAVHRCDRFGGPVTDDFLRDYASRTDAMGTRVLGCSAGGLVRGIAEVRALDPEGGMDAEAAFSVETDWQNRGIGTVLMAHAVALAAQRGIQQLFVCCNLRNRRMQRIGSRFGGTLEFSDGDCICQIGVESALAAAACCGLAAATVLASESRSCGRTPADSVLR